MSTRPPTRLPELEGLRGFLSWWVVVCHALTHSGYSIDTLGRGWRLLAHGDYAVDVFIILSGFVIHKLWHDSREPYRVFIARRFLRLWPAYIVCLIGSVALRPFLFEAVIHPPLGDPALAARRVLTFQSETAHYWTHLATHVPMLQSTIPETRLPSSAVALLGPAWSISLEWQFYLVAPLIFAALTRGRAVAWSVFAIVAGLGWLARYSPPLSVWFPMEAFLPQKLLLFAIGIASHDFWRAFRDYGGGIAPALCGLAVLVLAFTLNLPLAIWAATLAIALSRHSLPKRLLNSAPLQFLGRVSYSTYLGHMLVLWSLQAAAFALLPHVTQTTMLSILLGLGGPLILLLSALLHRWVEVPAIAYGRTLRRT